MNVPWLWVSPDGINWTAHYWTQHTYDIPSSTQVYIINLWMSQGIQSAFMLQGNRTGVYTIVRENVYAYLGAGGVDRYLIYRCAPNPGLVRLAGMYRDGAGMEGYYCDAFGAAGTELFASLFRNLDTVPEYAVYRASDNSVTPVDRYYWLVGLEEKFIAHEFYGNPPRIAWPDERGLVINWLELGIYTHPTARQFLTARSHRYYGGT